MGGETVRVPVALVDQELGHAKLITRNIVVVKV